jgi:hypothetical protein
MRLLSLLLTPLLALHPIWAQTNSSSPAERDSRSGLRVHVVEDSGPAQARGTSAKGYIIQVTDSSGAPVAAAAVAFRLPEEGPSGRLANGLQAWVSYTDAAGIAVFPPIKWGETAGTVEIRVTAAKSSSHAGILVDQQISALPSANTTVVAAAVPAATVVEVPVPTLAVAKPAAPQLPKIETETAQSTTLFQPFADVVPQEASKAIAPARAISTPADAPKSTPHTLTPNRSSSGGAGGAGAGTEVEPTVTIVNTKTGTGAGHEFNKKWWILAAVGAAAGVGALLASHSGGGGGGTTSSSGVSIGGPVISLGH